MLQDIDHWKQTIESLVAEKNYHRSLYTQTIVTSFSSTANVIDTNNFVASIFIKPARSINFITLNFVATRTGVEFEEIVGTV